MLLDRLAFVLSRHVVLPDRPSRLPRSLLPPRADGRRLGGGDTGRHGDYLLPERGHFRGGGERDLWVSIGVCGVLCSLR